MSTDVERVLDEIKALTTAELEQIRQKVDELLAAQTEGAKQSLEQSLFEAGLLSEIKTPSRDMDAFRAYQPIRVKGKPVSETIIEERR